MFWIKPTKLLISVAAVAASLMSPNNTPLNVVARTVKVIYFVSISRESLPVFKHLH